MEIQLNNGLFSNLPDNAILAIKGYLGELDAPLSDYNYIDGQLIRTRFSDFTTNFKIKMNSDSFVSMTSEVNAILPDLSNNVSMMGVTEIYLDKVDDELRTLLRYFDENLVIIERK